jgi:hypothetical protein
MLSCGEKNSRYMLPHTQDGGFNMEPRKACEEKLHCHTITDAKTHCIPKKQPPPIAVLWQSQKIFHHIKRKDRKTNQTKMEPRIQKHQPNTQKPPQSSKPSVNNAVNYVLAVI